MLRLLLDARALVAMTVAAVVGTWGLFTHPINADNVFLAMIELRNPFVFNVIAYGYATLWFTTSFLVTSLAASVLTIVVYRHLPTVRARPLPQYPQPETRPSPSLVLGEAHLPTTPGRAPAPTWLTIPQRGLYGRDDRRRGLAPAKRRRALTSTSCSGGMPRSRSKIGGLHSK